MLNGNILDSSGQPIKGLARDQTGALIVDDQSAFLLYKKHKDFELRLAAQEQMTKEIHAMLVNIADKLQTLDK